MSTFVAYTVAGVATFGCVYALTAMGLVVTYTTSGVFNFAQGAMGGLAAFLYWQLAVHFRMPSALAFVLVAFVFAPVTGALIEVALMRRVTGSSLEARLTVTVGLLLFIIAVTQWRWRPESPRSVPEWFNGRQVVVGGVHLSYQQLITVGTVIAIAIGLRLLLFRTLIGISTRAVVDNRDLVGLTGARPARYSMLGWALGSTLAAIAGVLLASTVNLDMGALTLLVINGYAAAMIGRLRSLPFTFCGAIILGLLQSYAVGYLPSSTFWNSIGNIVPMLFLFGALVIVPQGGTLASRVERSRMPRVPGLSETLITAGLFLVAAGVAAHWLSEANLSYANKGMCYGIVMLSLVVLTGYAGEVSLCQLTFAGIGAFAMAKVGGTQGSLSGLLAAVVISALVGLVVALPALKMRGLYLALATLAFAYGMDTAFFSSSTFFGANDEVTVARPHIPGLNLGSDRVYFFALAIVFGALGVGVLALRRSKFGRRLVAVSQSPSASVTVGVRVTRTRVAVFALAAGIAGLGGALYGGAQGQVGGGNSGDFVFLMSLTLLMLAVVWGIRTVGGMLLGGMSLALGPLLQTHLNSWWPSAPPGVMSLLVGLAALGVAQNPEGTFGGNTPLQKWREAKLARLTSERAVGESTRQALERVAS